MALNDSVMRRPPAFSGRAAEHVVDAAGDVHERAVFGRERVRVGHAEHRRRESCSRRCDRAAFRQEGVPASARSHERFGGLAQVVDDLARVLAAD
jgi:hypothetical protein